MSDERALLAAVRANPDEDTPRDAMSDERALLAAVRANPDEDTPRLMYADWLEEHGDAGQAEFVRLQVERSHTDRADPRWRELLGREAELLVAAKHTWLKPYQPWADLRDLTIHRGLVERATTSFAALAPHLDSVRDLVGLFELYVHGYHWSAVPAEEEPPNVPPPRRRGWLGTAVRTVVSLVRYEGAPAPPSCLCRLGLAARTPLLRVRAPLGSNAHYDPANGWLYLDLLDPGAPEPDPPLRDGTWTVLLWHPDVPDEWRLVGKLARALCLHTREAPAEFFRLNVAARPVRAADAVTTWAGLLARDPGPLWVRFRDGEPTERAAGFDPPPDWLAGVSL
jgi:uncharacterized protein (TIGR02996 family)